MRYLIVMLLWMGANRCLSEAGTEPKARLNSEGEAAARAEADEKLFASSHRSSFTSDFLDLSFGLSTSARRSWISLSDL
jgi:hypothetical protein